MGRVVGVVARSFNSWIDSLEDTERVAPLAVTLTVAIGILAALATIGVMS